MKLKIPSSIKIFGQTINIKFDKNLMANKNSYGTFDPVKNLILLQDPKHNEDLPHEQVVQTYCHELMHAILDKLSYLDLTADERFVDQVASALHQALTTAEYKQIES